MKYTVGVHNINVKFMYTTVGIFLCWDFCPCLQQCSNMKYTVGDMGKFHDDSWDITCYVYAYSHLFFQITIVKKKELQKHQRLKLATMPINMININKLASCLLVCKN